MEPLLTVNHLSVRLKKKGTLLVNDVSFQANSGQILGIIGESGSGKSMTCRALMGLLDPSRFLISGDAIFKGQDLFKLPSKKLQLLRGNHIAMIMQNPMTAFDPVTRIGSQMVETLRAHQPISKEQAVTSITQELTKLGLGDVPRILNSYPHELSGGMLQRIMIALALLLSPELIIADEATTALDVHTQAVILEEFTAIRNAGISMIVVTHNFGVLAKLADDVVVLRDGSVVEHGSVYQIFDKPTQPYTQELLQASNLKRGEFCDRSSTLDKNLLIAQFAKK